MVKTDWSVHRAILFSSISGFVVPLAVGLLILISGGGVMAAVMLFFALPIIGLFIGVPLSAIVAIFIYFPLYSIAINSPRIAMWLLALSGVVVGLGGAALFIPNNRLSPTLYLLFAGWGAVGGLLFFKGARGET